MHWFLPKHMTYNPMYRKCFRISKSLFNFEKIKFGVNHSLWKIFGKMEVNILLNL